MSTFRCRSHPKFALTLVVDPLAGPRTTVPRGGRRPPPGCGSCGHCRRRAVASESVRGGSRGLSGCGAGSRPRRRSILVECSQQLARRAPIDDGPFEPRDPRSEVPPSDELDPIDHSTGWDLVLGGTPQDDNRSDRKRVSSCTVAAVYALLRKDRSRDALSPCFSAPSRGGHGFEVSSADLTAPLGIDGQQPTSTCHNEMVEIAALNGNAVHPAPDGSAASSDAELVAGNVLAHGSAQMPHSISLM